MIEAWITGYVQRVTSMGALSHRALVGHCGVASRELAKVFGLTVVPGWVCLSANDERPEPGEPAHRAEHVWCVDSTGKIYDPTVLQFFPEAVFRYVPWQPGDRVRTGRCMNCGDDIHRAVQSLDEHGGQRDYVCSPKCELELDRWFNG
jgi:hypothetical protein